MVKGLIGKKIEMMQIYDDHGQVSSVTKIKVTPNFVVAIKQPEKDGYKAAQIGTLVDKHPKKPNEGIAKKAGLKETPKILREVDFDGEIKVGEEVTPDVVFRKGILVDVEGISKGKGFSGVVKRWGFAGGPRTHGQSDRERAPGSIGATTTPGRVHKGLKMAGHLGSQKVSIQGLEVIKIDKDENEILIKGSVPGARESVLLITKSSKKKKAYVEHEIPQAPVVAGAKEETPSEEVEKGEVSSVQPETVENVVSQSEPPKEEEIK
jgi:large subunit ribosomal protein L3